MPEKSIQAPKISAEEYTKYRGKDVALYENKIIAEGITSEEAIQKALKKYPKLKPQDIEIYRVNFR